MTAVSPQVAVLGLGYIGLPTAAMLASVGADVTGVDVKRDVVDAVNNGTVPFVEPDLGTVLAGAVQQGRLTASMTVPQADVYIIAVPTPFTDGHLPDLSFIEEAARSVAPKLRGGELVILESTSPPGATQHMADVLLAERPDLTLEPGHRSTVYVCHCPERVLPGRIMLELRTNDRICGGLNGDAAQRAQHLYQLFCDGEFLLTDATTAEMSKLVENSYRDLNIAFANELSVLADTVGVDVWELIELANHHPRVNILKPGPGVGGHCIAVDPWFLVSAAPDGARLIRMAREVNDDKPHYVLSTILPHAEEHAKPVIAALGLAFKADIDDLRESPAVYIAKELSERLPHGRILAVEPNIEQLPAELSAHTNIELTSMDSAIRQADIVVVLVDHSQFMNPPTDALLGKHIVDTRGIWRHSGATPQTPL